PIGHKLGKVISCLDEGTPGLFPYRAIAGFPKPRTLERDRWEREPGPSGKDVLGNAGPPQHAQGPWFPISKGCRSPLHSPCMAPISWKIIGFTLIGIWDIFRTQPVVHRSVHDVFPYFKRHALGGKGGLESVEGIMAAAHATTEVEDLAAL